MSVEEAWMKTFGRPSSTASSTASSSKATAKPGSTASNTASSSAVERTTSTEAAWERHVFWLSEPEDSACISTRATLVLVKGPCSSNEYFTAAMPKTMNLADALWNAGVKDVEIEDTVRDDERFSNYLLDHSVASGLINGKSIKSMAFDWSRKGRRKLGWLGLLVCAHCHEPEIKVPEAVVALSRWAREQSAHTTPPASAFIVQPKQPAGAHPERNRQKARMSQRPSEVSCAILDSMDANAAERLRRSLQSAHGMVKKFKELVIRGKGFTPQQPGIAKGDFQMLSEYMEMMLEHRWWSARGGVDVQRDGQHDRRCKSGIGMYYKFVPRDEWGDWPELFPYELGGKWQRLYHGIAMAHIWNVLYFGFVLPSEDDEIGHGYLKDHPGVYASDEFRVAESYSMPQRCFEEDPIYTRCVLDLRCNTTEQQYASSKRCYYVFRPDSVVIVGCWFIVGGGVEKGQPRVDKWCQMAEVIPIDWKGPRPAPLIGTWFDFKSTGHCSESPSDEQDAGVWMRRKRRRKSTASSPS